MNIYMLKNSWMISWKSLNILEYTWISNKIFATDPAVLICVRAYKMNLIGLDT